MSAIFADFPMLAIIFQSVVLLTFAFIFISVAMARRSAGARHLAWISVICGLLALPLLWPVSSGWGIIPLQSTPASQSLETSDGALSNELLFPY